MTRIKWLRGTAVSSIAAVLALHATQLLAQAAPDTTAPVTVAPVIPGPDITPEATTPSEPVANSTSQPLAAEPTIATKTFRKTKTARHVPIATPPAKAAPKAAQSSVATPATEPAKIVAESPAPIVTSATAPLPAVVPAPAPAPKLQERAAAPNGFLLIAGAVGVGLVGLIAFGLVMRRRKLRRDEELLAADQYEPAMEQSPPADPLFAEPAYQAASIDPVSAIPVVAVSEIAAKSEPVITPSPCADTAPGSHVEAACSGPTPDNPSLSIKKRLKRAHFFDQREFLVAAGEAAPMASDAGLPDSVTVPELPIEKPA